MEVGSTTAFTATFGDVQPRQRESAIKEKAQPDNVVQGEDDVQELEWQPENI